MATVVALLMLNFVDEHFNDARYTRAATAMLSHMARSFTKVGALSAPHPDVPRRKASA